MEVVKFLMTYKDEIDVDQADAAGRSALKLVRLKMASGWFTTNSAMYQNLAVCQKLLLEADLISVIRRNELDGVTTNEGQSVRNYCQGLLPTEIGVRDYYPKVIISYATGTRNKAKGYHTDLDDVGCGLGMQYARLLIQKLGA